MYEVMNVVNSHYVPQFILRHFCVDDKIQYCDIQRKSVEARTTRTVFSEKGYYPDELEHDLCIKVESQFANLLNNKLVSERRKIVLSDGEMLLLKKYLMVSVFRYKTDELDNDLTKHGLTREEIESISGDFYGNINKVLACKTKEEACSYCIPESKNNNINLFSYMKDILYSYTLFVRTNNCKEDFIIPDRGWASYEGPIHIEKLIATLDAAMKSGDQTLFQIARMITPHDYSIFPLAHDLAVMTVSVFFKLLTDGVPKNIKFEEKGMTVSKALGFGDRDIIKPPVPKKIVGMGTEYHCEIQQLSKRDVHFLNALLLANTDRYFAYGDKTKVEKSIKDYGKYDFALS